MRPMRMLLGLVSLALLSPGLAWAGQGAPTSFAEARAEAAAQDKLLLVDFFTEW